MDETLEEVPLVPLEKDVVPRINEFFETYYNDMVNGDRALADFLLEMNAGIKKNVGETLARVEGTEQIASKEGDAEESSEEDETPEEESASSETVVTEVKTTDVVNIRTSEMDFTSNFSQNG